MNKFTFLPLLTLASLSLFASIENSTEDVKTILSKKGISKDQIEKVATIYNELKPEVQNKLVSVLGHPYVKENFVTLFLQNYDLETGIPDFRALSAVIDTEENLLVMLWMMINKTPDNTPENKSKPNPIRDWNNALIQAQGRMLGE